MSLFSHILFSAVISCSIMFIVFYPSLAMEILTTYFTDVYYAFSVKQWQVILPFLVLALIQPLITHYCFKRKRWQYDGRHLVAQSLGTTSQDRNIATTSDESNQSIVAGGSLQTTTSLQVQVAPNINEDVLLESERTTQVYSTPMYVGQYPFASSNIVGDNIFYIESNQIYTNANIKRLFNDRRFCKFDVRFTINVTGNPMATGVLAVASLPYGNLMPGSVATQDSGLNYAWTYLYGRILASNHVLMDMSVDGVYKIDMPYTYYKSYMSTFGYTTDTPYAVLAASVISPYLPPTGQTTSINLEVYASIINLESIETSPYLAQSLLSINEHNTIVNQMEGCSNSSLPVNVTGDHLSATVPNPVGLDCPPDTRNAEMSVFRMAYQKLHSYWNKVDVTKTSVTPMEEALFDKVHSKELRLDVDEMSMDFFRGRWYYPASSGAVTSITTSTATGAQLFKYDLTPIPLDGGFSSNFTASSTCDFSQWLTSFFRFWRGSLRYRIIIASNSFKRGKILICVNYGGATNSLPSPLASNAIDPRSLHHIIVDLSNKDRVVDIDVPYKSIFEYLRVPNLTRNGNMPYEETSMGTIAAYLVSPLQVNNGTATTVNLTVLQCLGTDFNLYKQMQISTVGTVSQSALDIKGFKTPLTRPDMMVPFDGLQQLLRTQWTPYGDYALFGANVPPNAGVTPIMIPIHPVLLSSDALWAGVTQMYSGMRGGYRLKLQFGNVEKGSSFRVQYFDSLVPLTGSGNGMSAPTYAGTALSTIYQTWRSNILYSGVPEMQFLPQTAGPTAINSVPASTAGAITAFGIPAISDFIVDPYSQPELVLELPDPAPMYRTQQTLRVFYTANGYQFGGAGLYNPFADRNIGWLVIHPMDSGTDYNDSSLVSTVSVSIAAADDFRAFWYNGGPTSIVPQCFGYTGTGTTYTYGQYQGR